jgi:hypothetical protein
MDRGRPHECAEAELTFGGHGVQSIPDCDAGEGPE